MKDLIRAIRDTEAEFKRVSDLPEGFTKDQRLHELSQALLHLRMELVDWVDRSLTQPYTKEESAA